VLTIQGPKENVRKAWPAEAEILVAHALHAGAVWCGVGVVRAGPSADRVGQSAANQRHVGGSILKENDAGPNSHNDGRAVHRAREAEVVQGGCDGPAEVIRRSSRWQPGAACALTQTSSV